jgi:hypothetical protein
MQRPLPEPFHSTGADTPPLSILDLLLCMGAISIGLTFHNLLRTFQPVGMSSQVLGAVYTCLAAVTVASLPRFLARWRRGERPLLPQPGHWLLAISAVVTLLSWGMYYVMFWQYNAFLGEVAEGSLAIMISFLSVYCLMVAVAGGLNGVAAWRLSRGAGTRPWRLYFLAAAALCLAHVVIVLFHIVAFMEMLDLGWGGGTLTAILPLASIAWRLIPPAEFILLGFVAVWDWPQRAERDWLHRAGVGLLLATGLCSLLQTVLSLLG